MSLQGQRVKRDGKNARVSSTIVVFLASHNAQDNYHHIKNSNIVSEKTNPTSSSAPLHCMPLVRKTTAQMLTSSRHEKSRKRHDKPRANPPQPQKSPSASIEAPKSRSNSYRLNPRAPEALKEVLKRLHKATPTPRAMADFTSLSLLP